MSFFLLTYLNINGLCVIFKLEGVITGGNMQIRKIAFLTLALQLLFCGSLFAQQSAQQTVVKEIKPPVIAVKVIPDDALTSGVNVSMNAALASREHYIYWSWLNSRDFIGKISQDDERKQLRSQWQELLGVEVFMPYFKVKEVEDVVSSKTSVTFFNMKGKARFNDNYKSVEYIFKKKF